ncbi:hypothetical protein GCM10014713_17610 [Streptomyces purpureus]|uniref:Uncharacterized protein n=1 Tax=Streptomyces purpureus TaxID=1951 RepID=A0A918LN03_9ACTN|nr:hypothetical protein GCM10014713_17610 [Streptomyces purpureus]
MPRMDPTPSGNDPATSCVRNSVRTSVRTGRKWDGLAEPARFPDGHLLLAPDREPIAVVLG